MFHRAFREDIVWETHMRPNLLAGLLLASFAASTLGNQPPAPTMKVAMRTVDLNVGETQDVVFANAKKVTVRLVSLKETRDELRDALRLAEATVEIDGKKVTLVSANYHLPTTIAGVQVDCPVTKGYRQNAAKGVAGENPWGLDKDARIRLWPAGEPLLTPGTFLYPARQRWFASGTQMANEPVHVDGGENPLIRNIYYHYGLDIGGAEGLVEVVAATDGIVVSSGKAISKGYEDTPAKPRYDVVYLLDERGWYYRYSHLHTIAASVKPGAKVKMGQVIGLLGKEGGSGGWSHLHFDISGKQPSGKWGIIEGYAFLWEAYQRKYQPKLLAVARPHHLAAVGQKITLDGSRSWSADGKIVAYDWTFTDGAKASGAKVERTYSKPGVYSEILKIKNGTNRIDYDFAVVNVLDKNQPDRPPPSIHAVYYPTFGIKSGDPVTFMVRTFRTTDGREAWNFGDGSPTVEVQSDGNIVPLAKDGYARTVHRFEKAGHYLVRVERTNSRGQAAIAHVHVRVDED
jgi:murein DD-endopeptidase MepM/ murein hydrolase activator NlpD